MKKIFSIVLALVFLASNLGFAIGTHYCGDHAVINKVVLGEEDLVCGMDMMKKRSMKHSEEIAKAKGCCENVFQDLQIEDDYKSNPKTKSPEAQFALLFAITYADLFVSSSEKVISEVPYNSPPLERDLTVLFHSFLV